MAENSNDRNRALALAGVFQAGALVARTARMGRCEPAQMRQILGTLFTFDAEDVESVFGSLVGIRPGLTLLAEQLANPPDRDLTRYAVSMLHHAGTVVKRRDLAVEIRTGLEATQSRLAHFDVDHDNIVAGLADVYGRTISRLSPRVMVKGDPQHLSQPGVANAVRALLLAGIRSGVLWHQCGGGRVRLLLGRRGLVRAAQDLLAAV